MREEEEVEVWKRRQSLQASGGAAQTQEAGDGAHGATGKMETFLSSPPPDLFCQ